MKEPDWKKCTEKEAWEFIAVHLAKKNIETVLVGGSVVSIYTKGLYRSGDLDIVTTSYIISAQDISQAMSEIGFYRNVGRHYIKEECKHLFVEFLSPPVSIGDDYKIKPSQRKIEGYKIKILSPTDAIKDRLASYIYFKSRESLEQAVLITKTNKYNVRSIRNWCKKEGPEAFFAFNEFQSRLTI